MRLKSDKDEGFNKKLRAERLLKQNYISSYAAIIQVSFRLATHILKIKKPNHRFQERLQIIICNKTVQYEIRISISNENVQIRTSSKHFAPKIK